MTIRQLTAFRDDVVGESILWDEAEACLWWIDIPGRALRRFAPETGTRSSVDMPSLPGFVALGPVGMLVIGLEHEIGLYDTEKAQFVRHIPIPNMVEGMRTNDCVVARNGELFFGVIAVGNRNTPSGDFRRLSDPGVAIETGVHVPNGMAVSPDGRKLYFADTFSSVQSIWTRSYNPESGEIGSRKHFASTESYPGRPDGATVDADGGYWIAAVTAGELMRFNQDGDCDHRIKIPASHPTKLCFGGPDLSTIFATTIGTSHPSIPVTGEMSGAVVAVDTQFKGLPEQRAIFPHV